MPIYFRQPEPLPACLIALLIVLYTITSPKFLARLKTKKIGQKSNQKTNIPRKPTGKLTA